MSTEQPVDYYAVMALKSKASQKQIGAAYARLTKQYAGPYGAASDQLKQLELAYATLSSPDLRPAYDVIYNKMQKEERKRLRDEDLLANNIHRQSGSHALRGLIALVIGANITMYAYITAKAPWFFVIGGGLLIFGIYRFLIGMYHYYYGYPLMREAVGDEAAQRFYSQSTGRSALAKVGGMAFAVVLFLSVGTGFSLSSSGAPLPIPQPIAAAVQEAPVTIGSEYGANTSPLVVTPTLGSTATGDIQLVAPAQKKTASTASASQQTATTPIVMSDSTPVTTVTPTPAPTPTPIAEPTPIPTPTPVVPVINPVPLPTTTVCGVAGVGTFNSATGSVASLTPTTEVVNGVTGYILTIPSMGGGLIYNISPTTTVYSASCALLDHSLVAAGDSVQVYAVPDTNPATVHVVGETIPALILVDQSRP